MVFSNETIENFSDKTYMPSQYSRSIYLFEVYKTDEENFEPYVPKGSTEDSEETEEVETTDEENEEEEEEEEEEDEDDESNKFKLHQGEILEKYYYTELTGMEVSYDYTDISNTGSVNLPFTDTNLSQCYLGVRTLLRKDWETYGENKSYKELPEANLGFITDESFSDELTKLSISGMTKLLEQKYEFNFTQMKRSDIIREIIKTAGLKDNVDAEGLLDEVIDYTNVSSSDSDSDSSADNSNLPAETCAAAKKIVKGKKGDKAKAQALYDWIDANMKYYNYNNSHFNQQTIYADVKANLGAHRWNCCDHAHLSVAFLRCVGIKANYMHGHGHVWAVAYLNGQRVMFDPLGYQSRPMGQAWGGNSGTESESIGF